MAERYRSITRNSIGPGSEREGRWLEAYLAISDMLFSTEWSRQVNESQGEDDPDVDWVAGDFARDALYNNLMDATAGELEVPESLGDDQIEDWFVARAMRRGLEDNARALEVRQKRSQNNILS